MDLDPQTFRVADVVAQIEPVARPLVEKNDNRLVVEARRVSRCAHRAAGSHPDGHQPARDGWLGGDARAQGDEATRAIPIIALTAHAMEADRLKALEVGCDDFDTKPVELLRRLAKMDELLGRGAGRVDG